MRGQAGRLFAERGRSFGAPPIMVGALLGAQRAKQHRHEIIDSVEYIAAHHVRNARSII
jgi:hypothetical protein